jgi:hypothetical protein
MTVPKVEAEICKYLHQLPLEQQRQALEFVRTLAAMHVRGVPGQSLLRFSGTIDVSDLATMTQAIEDGCEQVYGEDW